MGVRPSQPRRRHVVLRVSKRQRPSPLAQSPDPSAPLSTHLPPVTTPRCAQDVDSLSQRSRLSASARRRPSLSELLLTTVAATSPLRARRPTSSVSVTTAPSWLSSQSTPRRPPRDGSTPPLPTPLSSRFAARSCQHSPRHQSPRPVPSPQRRHPPTPFACSRACATMLASSATELSRSRSRLLPPSKPSSRSPARSKLFLCEECEILWNKIGTKTKN